MLCELMTNADTLLPQLSSVSHPEFGLIFPEVDLASLFLLDVSATLSLRNLDVHHVRYVHIFHHDTYISLVSG